MASLTLSLDKRSGTKTLPIKLRISHKCTSSFVNTGIRISPDDFTGDLYKPIKPRAHTYAECTELLSGIVRKYESAIFDLTRDGVVDSMSANDIRDYVDGKKTITQNRSAVFNVFLDKYASERRSKKSMDSYVYTAKLLRDYQSIYHNSTPYLFNEITYKMLSHFNKWLEDTGRGISTRGIVLRNIRAAYNEARRLGYIKDTISPFEDLKIKTRVHKEVEYLTFEDMSRLLSLDLTNQQGEATLDRARDIFMISFLLCGMNLTDIFSMGKQDGNEIVFVRNKIAWHEPDKTHIRIIPQLQELLSKYKGKNHMFCFADEFKNYETFQRNLTGRFDRISELLGKHINMSIARHTWATLCSMMGVEKYVISKSLGHVDDDVTGIFYIQYDWNRTYKANKDLADKVYGSMNKNSIKVPVMIKRK